MSNDLEAAAERLADLLAQENDTLKRMDLPAAAALVPAKEAALTDLTRQPKATAPSPSLLALELRLGALAGENQELLERAIAVQTRIVRIVARACAPVPPPTRYGGRDGRSLSLRTGALALSTRA